MLKFNNIEEMKEYYNKNTNTYEFEDKNGVRQDITINFNLIEDINIKAGNIIARNLDVWNINAANINADNIKAFNIKAFKIEASDIEVDDIVANNIVANNIVAGAIDALNISANDINALIIEAWDITYYAFCIARQSLKCKSIRGERDNCIHRCLDKKIEYIKDEKLTEEQVIKQLEELIEDRQSFIDTADEDDEFFIKDRQALKQAVELLKQSNKVKLELKSFKDDIDTKLKKYKNVKMVIPAEQIQQKVDNLIKFFNN